MAMASGGTLGTDAHATSATSFTLTTATNSLSAGEHGLLVVVTDNSSTADGDNNEHTAVSGGTGTWRKLGEYTNSPTGAAADGVTVSVWWFRATAALAIGSVITMTLASAVVDKCASFWKFTTTTTSMIFSVSAAPQTSEVTAANGYGSSSFSGLANDRERLYLLGLAKEANTTTAITPTTNFTAISGTRSRNNAAAVIVRGEFRLNTSTGETSNPTLAVSGDTAGVFVALEEVDPALIGPANGCIVAA